MRYHPLSLFAALGSLALGALQPVRATVPDSLYQALNQRVKILERLYELEQETKRSARSATAWSLGINWYLHRNTKLNLDYGQTQFKGGGAKGDRDTEKILFNRFQVSF